MKFCNLSRNPFKLLTKFEWMLYLSSLAVIFVSFIFGGSFNPLITAALLVGATSLIFIAKGEPIGQILTVIFSLLYAAISLEQRYYGEMITYLGMTMPIAAMAAVSWLKNPYEKNKSEVKVSRLSKKCITAMWLLAAVVTFAFYFVLKFFETPNLFFSTVSIATSFIASYLTLFRSPFYAVAYAANDIVLIILWVLASVNDSSYIPMIICFFIFLANDTYGFVNWRRMKKRQSDNI